MCGKKGDSKKGREITDKQTSQEGWKFHVRPALRRCCKRGLVAKLRDVWPEHWGDVLPAAIDCPAEYLRAPWCLRTARPRSERKIYSELISDPFYDDDWLRSFDKLFKVTS